MAEPAIPISPITLEDVKNELGLESTATLEDCAEAADSNGFNSYYVVTSDPKSAPFDLLDFRAYTPNTPPNAPSSLFAIAKDENTIGLDWTAASDPDGSIDHYNVYRNGVKIATATDTSYTVQLLSPGTEYCFYVTAVDDDGAESDASNTDCDTTLYNSGYAQ